MLEHWLRMFLKIAPILAIIPVLGFIVVYQWRGKWWKSAIGRYMMGSMVAWCFVIGFTILVQFARHIPYLLEFGVLAWATIIAIKLWSFVVIFRSMVLHNYDEQEVSEREEMDSKYK